MKNNLFKILSLNIYENSSKNFLKFEKSSKNSQANARKPQKPVQRKKSENKIVKQNTKPYRKNTGYALMGRGPYHSARGRSKQRPAHRRSIGIAVAVIVRAMQPGGSCWALKQKHVLPMMLPARVILFAVTEFLATGSQVPLLFVIDAI
jgi:hypothetical protein